jgi:hypothetical protein
VTAPADIPATRNYPLTPRHDPRFSPALIRDVAEVLKAHGYPQPAGSDLADLVAALWGFLYAPARDV